MRRTLSVSAAEGGEGIRKQIVSAVPELLATAKLSAGSLRGAGVGFGARYNLGFGPLRADLAIPLSRHKGDAAFQIYLSVGQSF